VILHITHNDLDGVSCGILLNKYLKDVETIYCNYAQVDDALIENARLADRVIISDLSPSRRAYERVMGEVEVIVIDHHQTSTWLNEYPGNVHDMNMCASMLVHQWLKGEGYDVSAYDDYVDCVNDFDLWKLKREDSLEMNMLFMKYGIYRFYDRFIKNSSPKFNEMEKVILELETEKRDFYIKKASSRAIEYKDRDGLKVFIVFAEEYNSELGNHIIVEMDADYVVLVNMQMMKASLRSRREVSIVEIAEMNGGGGHKNAAGFPIDFDFRIDDFLHEAGIL